MGLYAYDAAFRAKGYAVIAGVDEAGRGPLAGPVVAAAVILPEGLKIEGIRDSKVVPQKERERLFREISLGAAGIGIGVVAAEEIDRINILEATKRAMQEAVKALPRVPDLLLIDALYLSSLPIEQKPIIKGDAKSASIAAASIIAKVHRDEIMLRYHALYPHYGFDRHKGYGTKAHLSKINEYGPCPIHRRSFGGVLSLPLPFCGGPAEEIGS
jgi:ribonuclease HII